MPKTDPVESAPQQVLAAIEHELVVVESFLGHVRGDVITEAETVRDLLESEWVAHFVKRVKPA